MKHLIYLLLIVMNGFTMNAQTLTLNPLISDNMVLQQKTEVNVWGKAKAGAEVNVKASWGEQAVVIANADGTWLAKIKTVTAGGPYVIKVGSAGKEITVNNVMLGEVWLCSGQSNMEMPLAGWPPADTICGSADEIKNSENSGIRMFTVQKNFSLMPLTESNGAWEVSSPATSPRFSAVAYFFAKKLYKETGIPVGIIHSSWGGTPIESWISLMVFASFPEFSNEMQVQRNLIPMVKKYNDWLIQHQTKAVETKDGIQNWKNLDFDDSYCSSTACSDTYWGNIDMPCRSWETTEIGEFDGVVWFRKKIELKETPKNTFELLIPGIDDMDRVYINGQLVGATEEPGFWQTSRKYSVPTGLLKKGMNSIAIRIIDNQGGGGLGSTETPFELQSTDVTIPLKGTWKYSVAAEYKNGLFYVLDIKHNEWFSKPSVVRVGPQTNCVLYNAMINPLIHYTIKGTLWYQGETNVGRANQYKSLLQLMARCWRDAWQNQSMPLYVVQLAPWLYSGFENPESAELRNAQRKAVQYLDHSGLVVTLDLGNISSVHPGKKREVGERLALWALNKDYAKPIVCSGPLYKSSSVVGNSIEIEFDYVGGGLLFKNVKNEFQIAGRDKKFVPAEARIVGNKVVVSSLLVSNPAYVRYAFANGSDAMLYNTEGLPASTFETD